MEDFVKVNRTTLDDALLGRDTTAIVCEESSRHCVEDAANGPMAASEAHAIAERFACLIDADAVLSAIACEDEVTTDGKAEDWRIDFHLPVRKGIASFLVQPMGKNIEIHQLIASLENVEDYGVASSETIAGIELPIPFRDSPDVVSPFVTDSNAGDGMQYKKPLRLATGLDESGKPVWKLSIGDKTEQLPLAA